KKFHTLKYIDLLKKRLKVMDATAVSLCMDNKLPIVVFNLNKKDNIRRVVLGQRIGTIIK
ncbi:MAG: UMP kinase, partial [Candidatus Omnitrophota bacterium]